MSYQDLEIPSRALHLWRYTPWARIHPSKPEELPQAESLNFVIREGGELLEGAPRVITEGEIARAFLSECGGSSYTLDLSGQAGTIFIDARAIGEVCVGHLHIVNKGEATVILNITGNADWVGLHVTGEITANSQLAWGFINELSSDAKLLHCEDWKLNADAQFESATLSLGAFRSKSDMRCNITGKGSSLRQAIAVHGAGAKHADHHIEIHHMVSNSDSNLRLNSACGGSSHSIATGLLTIAESANQTDAGQVFRNLLLSEKARAESIPELEVLADDVKAAHGAASAPISSEQLHYLQARGLSLQEAEAMIVEGFLIDAFSNLDNGELKDAMRARLIVHLECDLR